MSKTVAALFENRKRLEQAVQALLAMGIPEAEISLLARQDLDESAKITGDEVSREAAKGAGTGAVAGIVGGIALSLAGVVVPGLGAIAAAGPVAALVTGAGIGGIGGGLIGALTGRKFSDEHAQRYVDGVRRGGVLLLIDSSDERAGEIEDVLQRHGGRDVTEHGGKWHPRAGHPQGLEPHQRPH
ncbi:general stress protein [Thermithiobacillus plumbiphilus]|uniref:General stress protein n=1 Tax=Thermithiobacillus plumbiphilus TaxID=1729899 RepID=A0ABU9D9P5_9PROT